MLLHSVLYAAPQNGSNTAYSSQYYEHSATQWQ